VGVSGAKERRPQLDELLAECRKRRFDSVVVYRYDRFARSLRQLVNALAEFERELIRDRVRSGIASARARGKSVGRPRRDVDVARVAALRAEGLSWREVGRELGIGVATARTAFQDRAKNRPAATTT
jgi:DNA invertase Pin-like site-specific DNA recombinase